MFGNFISRVSPLVQVRQREREIEREEERESLRQREKERERARVLLKFMPVCEKRLPCR